jgi:hypothetical protein
MENGSDWKGGNWRKGTMGGLRERDKAKPGKKRLDNCRATHFETGLNVIAEEDNYCSYFYAPMITAGQILLEQTVGKIISPHPTDFQSAIKRV